MEYSVVICCAGMGERMKLGYNKLFLKLATGRSVIETTVSVFLNDPNCREIVLVTKETEQPLVKPLFSDERIVYAMGGGTRQESVYHGLQKVSYPNVLIHDGARPYLSQGCIDRLLKTLAQHEACLLMVPCKDTIKIVREGKVISTPPREEMMASQTPQAFHTQAILACHIQARQEGIQATDDASLYERYGSEDVYAVEGDYANLKITTPEDVR